MNKRLVLLLWCVLATTAVRAQTEAAIVCANNWRNVMEALPAPAAQAGSAMVAFTVTGDRRVDDVRVLKSSSPVHAQAAVAAVRALRCDAGGESPVKLQALIVFKAAPA